MDYSELKDKRRKLAMSSEAHLKQLDALASESNRVADVAQNSREILDSIDAEFERITSLDKTDVVFVMFASFLQALRWILMPELKLTQLDKLSPEISKEDRLLANEKNHTGGIYDGKSSGAEYELSELEKYREKHPELSKKSQEEFYERIKEEKINEKKPTDNSNKNYRSWIEILTQPVPYDAMNALDKSTIPNIANLNKQKDNGEYNNIFGKNHHVATLGHDPILGWIFGTANILTSTISFVDFQNYDVIRGHRIRSLGEFATSSELQFSDQAIDYMSPRGVFDILGECILSTKEDSKRLCAAVVRQAIHLASDKYCVEGLPIPILSSIDPQKAQELIEKGWNSIEFGKLVKHDLLQIGASAAISAIINLIIEAIYLFCIQSNLSMDVRRVKLKKIIRISDVISSSSNILYVSLTKNINKLDIGGIDVTMINLLRSNDFIIGVKREYISENFNALVTNE